MIIQGRIVDIQQQRIFKGELEIRNGKIHAIREVDHSIENYILPGFVDAHIHIESSMLVPSEFAKIALTHGTVATVSDPHEIANVLGVINVCSGVPITVRQFAENIADTFGKRELLRFGARPDNAVDPFCVIGIPTR